MAKPQVHMIFSWCALLLAALVITGVHAQPVEPQIVVLTWRDGQITGHGLATSARGAPVLRLRQGEAVELRWTSDRAAVLHLHGYDIKTRVAPNAPAVMAFMTRATGRFPVETHDIETQGENGRHRTLLYLEVHPR